MKPVAEPKLWVALGLGLLVGLVNLAKPVHIDDALYLEIARRITTRPLDPYGGVFNWQQVPEPTYKVSISPPLLSYVFALVMLVGGENVVLLHASMVPWLLLASWGVYRLGARWAGAGLLTVVLVIGGPAVVAGTNLMLDVPLLACLCATVECLARGTRRALLAASAFAAAGVGIKFTGVAAVPLFLVAALTRRRWGPALAALGPVAVLAGWQVLSRSLYGASQVSAGMSFLSGFQASLVRQPLERALTMTALLATTFPVWLAAPWRSRRVLGPVALAASATLAAAWLLHSTPMNRLPGVTPAFLGAVFLGTVGLAAIVWPGREAWPSSPSDPRPWLATWMAASVGLVLLFGPFVAVRSFLPVLPPLAIWLIGRNAPAARPRGALGLTAAVTVLLGGLLGATDLRWARCYPAAVRQVAARRGRPDRPIEFLGHWGWQYYAERAGWRAWDARRLNVPTGAIVVVPLRADAEPRLVHPLVARRFHLRDRIDVPPSPLGLTTWDRPAGFRFHGGDFGQLPWGPSSAPTERFFVYEVGPP